MTTIDFKQDLNEEQYRAATAPDGPVLVLAAAGTGKTRTLVYRVAYLVHEGASPDSILLLTFTNRAAREMLDRARELVGAAVSGVWGGTFHHMANRLLRRHAARLGYESGFTILDREDSRSLVRDCVRDLNLKGPDFPKRDVLLGIIGQAANTGTDVAQIAEERFDDAGIAQGIGKVAEAYAERKSKMGGMDFDDLLVNCVRLLREQPDILERYQEQFRHVLVDEYQDTNSLQAEMVDRMAARNRNVLVVGDDFQSIYSWRGADYRNIMSFPERYEDARVFKLETNYRSVPEILEVANACIAGNPDQYQKTLRATRSSSVRPRTLVVRDGREQALAVVDHVMALRRQGYGLGDIAVLYRAHFHAMEVQMALSRERWPYVITSGVRFFEQAHIKDVCSLLRVQQTPTDEMAFTRLVGLLHGVGPRRAEKAWQRLGGNFDVRSDEQRQLLGKALGKQAAPGWKQVERVLADHGSARSGEQSGEMVLEFVETFYADYAARSFENARQRLDDVREMVLYLARFDCLDAFLNEVALMTNLDAEAESVGFEDRDSLKLSTVHQAKGLEWPAVILLWMTEGMFPSGRALAESEEAEAEERRLFYVAATRARDELCLCVPEVRRTRDGGVFYCEPSRFIQELPAGLLREVRPCLF